MLHKLSAALAALMLGLTLLAPAAEARDRGGRHGGYHDRGYYDRGHHGHRHHGRHYRDNDNDELAAGVIGLALGAVLGATIASSNNRSAPRYDDRYYAPPPPPRYAPQSYYDGGYGYDPGCVREVRQWDPYYGRYEYVQLRTPCD